MALIQVFFGEQNGLDENTMKASICAWIAAATVAFDYNLVITNGINFGFNRSVVSWLGSGGWWEFQNFHSKPRADYLSLTPLTQRKPRWLAAVVISPLPRDPVR